MSQSAATSPGNSLLVQVLSPSSNIASWHRDGILDREVAYLRDLASPFAGLLVVDADNPGIELNLGPRADILFGGGAPLIAAIASRLATPAWRDLPCVLRTQEFDASSTLLRIRERLIAQRRSVIVIARGTFPWTRSITAQHGPHSQPAHDAGAAEGLLARLADATIGASEAMVSDLAWRYQLDPMSTAVVPRFVSPGVPIRGADDRDRRVVLSVGPLTASSRASLLVEAVAALPESLRPNVRLHLIGEGPERERLVHLAKARGVDLHIASALDHARTLEAIASCAVYCQPAAADGPPPPLLDAMASGAAVVITDATHVARLIEHGFTGLRTPSDPLALARAIEGLLDDTAWRDALGTAAGNSVRDSHELQRLASAETAIIAQALRRPPAARPADHAA